jgi:hypothetical protein
LAFDIGELITLFAWINAACRNGKQGLDLGTEIKHLIRSFLKFPTAENPEPIAQVNEFSDD